MLHIRVIDGRESGKTHDLSISGNATLGELRRAIWRKTGVPWDIIFAPCQELTVRGKKLPHDDDTPTIANCGVANGDVVHLVEKKKELKRGRTYLNQAVRSGESDAVLVLTETVSSDEVDKKSNDDFGDTPLQWAVSPSSGRMPTRYSIVETLIGIGASSNVPNRISWKPLDHAAHNNSHQLIESLLMGGADINSSNPDNQTRAIGWAARQKNTESAMLLIEHGADEADDAQDLIMMMGTME